MNGTIKQTTQKLIEYPPGSHTYVNTLPKSLLLTRGFSKVQANEEILNETRSQIENNLKRNKDDSTLHITDLPVYSFMLPDLTQYDDDFKEYLQTDLIELSATISLSEAGHLNWWSTDNWEGVCRVLYPMVTSGDGNCLLHAASLAMWGLHDRYLILRKALHSTLKDIKQNSALWRRWKYEQMLQNRKSGLVYNDDEWNQEWSSLLKLSSYQPRSSSSSNNDAQQYKNQQNMTTTTTTLNNNDNSNNNTESDSSFTNLNTSTINRNSTNNINNSSNNNNNNNSSINDNSQDGVYFESLEEFHVFVLAHIIQRPIIIVSDTVLHDANGEPLAPIPFGGIYLPLECDINKCHRYPLVLTYDAAHFSALVLMDDDNSQINENELPYPIIPITYSNMDLLPIHFSYDPGPNFDWSKYQQQLINDNSYNNNVNLIKEHHLSRDYKMYLLQNYLNLIKIQLFLSDKEMIPDKVTIININVEQKHNKNAPPVGNEINNINNNNCANNNGVERAKPTAKNKLKELFKIFKPKKQKLTNDKSTCVFKNWNSLFSTLNSNTCILAARLNLTKPPKYDIMIDNYIRSARNKFDSYKNEQKMAVLKQQQQQQQYQQQQQQQLTNSPKSDVIIHNKCALHGCPNLVDYRYNTKFCRRCALFNSQ